VRIDALAREQEARSLRLSDPATQADVEVRDSLVREFERTQDKLDELTGRWEYAVGGLEVMTTEEPCVRPEPAAPVAVLDRLGRRIQALRIKRCLSQDVLGLQTGNPLHVVQGIERGQRSLSIEMAARFARALDVTLSELFVDVDHALPTNANRLGALLAGRSPEVQRKILHALDMLLPLASPDDI
jgi:transcriptional regulator with XRE-family HTH domain